MRTARRRKRGVPQSLVAYAVLMTRLMFDMWGVRWTYGLAAVLVHSAPRSNAGGVVAVERTRTLLGALLCDVADAAEAWQERGPDYPYARFDDVAVFFLETLPSMGRRRRRALERAIAAEVGGEF